MTNTEIVEKIYNDYNTQITNFIFKNLFHKQYTEDILQEIYLCLMGVENQKLLGLYTDKVILFYMKKMVLNLFNSKNKPYHKYIRIYNDYTDLPDIPVEEYDIEKDKLCDRVETFFEKQLPLRQLYKSNIVERCSIKKIAKKLKLPEKDLSKRFQKIKQIAVMTENEKLFQDYMIKNLNDLSVNRVKEAYQIYYNKDIDGNCNACVSKAAEEIRKIYRLLGNATGYWGEKTIEIYEITSVSTTNSNRKSRKSTENTGL